MCRIRIILQRIRKKNRRRRFVRVLLYVPLPRSRIFPFSNRVVVKIFHVRNRGFYSPIRESGRSRIDLSHSHITLDKNRSMKDQKGFSVKYGRKSDFFVSYGALVANDWRGN